MKKLLKVTILSLSLLAIMAGAGLSPALGNIKNHFSTASPFLIKLILTIPFILIMPTSIITGKYVVHHSKKPILIIGLILYIIGGITCSITNSIYILITLRGILGIGVGIIVPISIASISDFYIDREKDRLIGYSTAVNNFGGIIASLLAGILADINWRYVFSIYGIAIFVLLLVIFVLPEPELHHEAEDDSVVKYNLSKFIDTGILNVVLLSFVFTIIYYTVPANISMYVESRDIGSSSIAGLLVSALTTASFVAGILLTDIIRIFKDRCIFISLFSIFAGFLILSYANSLLQIIVSVVLVGLGIGTVNPLIYIKASNCLPPKYTTLGLAMVTSSFYFGKFICPIITDLLADALGKESLRFSFQFSTIVSIILILLFVIKDIVDKARKSYKAQ